MEKMTSVRGCSSLAENSAEDACLHVLHLASYLMLPFTVRAAIELGALEAIAKADRNLSPAEVAAELQCTANPDAPETLDRMLRVLASCNILTCNLRNQPDGSITRYYGPAPACKYLVPSQDGFSLASLLMLQTDRGGMQSCYHLKDAVVEGQNPMDKARGVMTFEFIGQDLQFNELFNTAMSNHSTVVMNKVLDVYEGFRGLTTVVDVGGGVGMTLHMIRSKYPEITGINFDLPHVIHVAPSLPGVKHVAGDMFECIPNGDAILLKWILHNWSDDQCIKLLKNCYEVLPDHGKVIVIEGILSVAPESDMTSKTMFLLDIFMLAIGGKERTKDDFNKLAKLAGFSRSTIICCIPGMAICVMELTK